MKPNRKSYETFTWFKNQKNFIVPRKNKMKILYMVENQKKIIVPRKNIIKNPLHGRESEKTLLYRERKAFEGAFHGLLMLLASVFC